MQLNDAAILIMVFFQQPPHRSIVLMRVDFQTLYPTLPAHLFRLFQNPAGNPLTFELIVNRDPVDYGIRPLGQPLAADHRRVIFVRRKSDRRAGSYRAVKLGDIGGSVLNIPAQSRFVRIAILPLINSMSFKICLLYTSDAADD